MAAATAEDAAATTLAVVAGSIKTKESVNTAAAEKHVACTTRRCNSSSISGAVVGQLLRHPTLVSGNAPAVVA